MSLKSNLFYNNRVYKLLSNSMIYSNEILQELNVILHDEPELAECNHPIEGSLFHIICRQSNRLENTAFRMIYALSNAGGDPNVTDEKGNTPLHEAIIRGPGDCGFDLIQALFRVGVDPRIVNHEDKTADAYIGDNPQLHALYKGYGDGIWAAIETNNISETERLIKGFIKINCKHNSNKTLLDKAIDNNCTSIIDILAEYQVTNEFLHSILACDFERTLIISTYEKKFIKINSFDSIHRLTWIRTCSKSLLEYSLNTQSSKLFEIFYNSSITKININILCTDGLPFFFHCFNEIISNNIRKNILFNANMFIKSSKGETFLFYLISLYIKNENKEYIDLFTYILHKYPLLLTQRNEQEQTIIEYIEFIQSNDIYNKLKIFYEIISHVLIIQLKTNSMIEKFILNHFGYYLLIFFKNKTLLMTKHAYHHLYSLKFNQGLIISISNLFQTIINDDFIKFNTILKNNKKIYYAKDSFGRKCIHLTILYQRYTMLKYICENYPNIINAKDNLNRTSYHYACIMNDKISIEILEQNNAKQIIDCMNLCPNDYLLNRDLCCEEYSANEFSKNEIQRKSSLISNYLKIAFYPNLRKAIETNSIEKIKLINKEMNQMGFYLKDLNPNSYLDDYIQGQRYIPLLFLALKHRSIASLQCLFDLGIPLIGRMYISKSKMDENSSWISFRSHAEELECFDIIDIINDLEDDIELKQIFQENLTNNNNNTVKIESETNLPERQNKMKNVFKYQNIKSQICVLI